MLTFTLLTEARHGQNGPRIRSNNIDVLLPVGRSTTDISIEDTGSFVIDFYNKTEKDTIVEQGQIVADTEFRIIDVWCDGILLESWFKNISVYRPNYFEGFLKHQPDAPKEIVSPYQFNFPGTISWTWNNKFWDWYFVTKNEREVIKFLDQDPDRVWKFRGSLDPCEDLVTKIKQVLLEL
jgi:hypothetical protein